MQKPFAVHRSPFTLKIAFSFLLLAFCSSCSFNANVQKPGEPYLQGEWRQDSVTNQKQLLSYSLYQLKFSCDSFYMSIHSFSKVGGGADSCTRNGEWHEFTRGTYLQSHDSVYLKGQFANADMTIKDDKGCFRAGDYDEVFKVSKRSDSLLHFVSTTAVIPMDLHLVKRTTCHPNPI